MNSSSTVSDDCNWGRPMHCESPFLHDYDRKSGSTLCHVGKLVMVGCWWRGWHRLIDKDTSLGIVWTSPSPHGESGTISHGDVSRPNW